MFGILNVARLEPGESVLISAAAGGVATVAGQIARIVGSRVFGIAGSQVKRDLLVDTLGFDGALNCRAPALPRTCAACSRTDWMYFENVGWATSQAVMHVMPRRPG